MTVYFCFLGLLALQRIMELGRSKRNWQYHRDRAERPPERLYFWMVLLHSSIFVILPLELIWRRPEFGGPISFLAIAVTTVAFGLRIWMIRTMGRSWNVRLVHGPGYPIVSHGPYRYIRHPNYLVVFLELLAIPMIYHLYWSAAMLSLANALILRVRIRNEEIMLRQNPEWVAAMAAKPRFIPGLF